MRHIRPSLHPVTWPTGPLTIHRKAMQLRPDVYCLLCRASLRKRRSYRHTQHVVVQPGSVLVALGKGENAKQVWDAILHCANTWSACCPADTCRARDEELEELESVMRKRQSTVYLCIRMSTLVVIIYWSAAAFRSLLLLSERYKECCADINKHTGTAHARFCSDCIILHIDNVCLHC